MKVLHVGVFRDHRISSDYAFRSGFLHNGIDPLSFDFRTVAAEVGVQTMNDLLVEQASDRDLVFVTMGELISPQTLHLIRKRGTAVALFYGDMREEPEPWLLPNLKECDLFLMTSAGDVLKRYFDLGKPERAAFIWNPSIPELVNEFSSVQRSVDPPLFTATLYPHYGTERQMVHNHLGARGDIQIIGCPKRLYKSRLLNRVFYKLHPPEYLRGRAYMERIVRAKFGIGVSSYQNVKYYSSDRIVHYLTFGKLFLAYRFPGSEDILQDEVHVVYYDSVDDLAEKIDFYLANQALAEEIGRRGQEKTLNEYNCTNTIKMVLDVLRTGQSDVFPWSEVYP